MELTELRVKGLRCLEDIDWIPIAHPTILTGANDGGKTTVLLALEFFLTGKGIDDDDFTNLTAGGSPVEGGNPVPSSECSVEARLSLSSSVQTEFALPPQVEVRRGVMTGESSTLQIRRRVPVDPRLRDLERRSLAQLKEIADALGVQPEGRRNLKESFLTPLKQAAGRERQEHAWVTPDPGFEDRLPRLISFASTAEPDPETEIRSALREAYSRALDNPEMVAPIREVEARVSEILREEANQLREHIIAQCPELSNLIVEPEVSFKEGFSGVRVSSSRGGGPAVHLSASGAGTQRRISLATWEWTQGLLLDRGADDQSVIVGYDEPDSHLDYRHQRDLLDLIRRQCEIPGVRVVIATHSLNLIDKVPIEDVVHLELIGGRTSIRRLFGTSPGEVDRHLMNVALSMGLRNSVLLHERCFVGVEGVTEQQALPILFQMATGMTLQAAGIALVPAGGNTGALAFCKYLAQQGREVRFIIDSDSTRQRTFSTEKLKEAGISEDQMYLVGAPDEIEDVFSDDQWASAANLKWPRSDGAGWTTGDFSSIRGSGKFSTRLHQLVNDNSGTAPATKSTLLPSLAETLQAPGEIPKQLTRIFSDLIEVTSAR